MINLLPWNHFGRKNVGYLYAILHGALEIWDFDDDNGLLLDDMLQIPDKTPDNKTNTINVRELKYYSYPSFNPYPLMGAPSSPCWPRGIPLEHIKSNLTSFQLSFTTTRLPVQHIGIIQSLANHDPDMDAIYRLTQPLPFDFPAGAYLIYKLSLKNI